MAKRSESTLRAARAGKGGRRPKRNQAGRTCLTDGCGILLSSYNTRDQCYRHWPTRYPRLRGTIDSGVEA